MEVFITNYNRAKRKYDLFHVELVDLSSEELKDLLFELPVEEEFIRIQVITDYHIFQKVTETDIQYKFNAKGIRSGYSKYIPIDEIESIPKTLKIKKRKKAILFYSIMFYGIFGIISLPIYNILIILINFKLILPNISHLVIFIMLLLFSIYSIQNQIKLELIYPIRRNIPIFEMEYAIIPYLIKEKDLSTFIAFYGQLFYPLLFEIYSIFSLITYFKFFWLIIVIFCAVFFYYIVLYPILYIIDLKKNRKFKDELMQFVLEKMFLKVNSGERGFYLNIYHQLKAKPLYRVSFMSKLIAIASFIFTILPILLE